MPDSAYAVMNARLIRFLMLFVCILPATLWLAAPACGQDENRPDDDPIYDRPFIASFGSGSTAVGGYAEGNTNYFAEDGVTEGFSMELRRFNLFLYSSIGSRISFFTELEFEHGTEEIKLETALIDFEINSGLILRGGIILPPVGMFNQNHDSPKWDFVDRPLVSTRILPATLSEVGFGIHGRLFPGEVTVGYQAYVVNGLGDGIVSNGEGRTFIPGGKNAEMFGEDNNGIPAITGRVGVSMVGVGEVGFSVYAGTYNSFRIEGDEVDERRRVSMMAFDARVAVGRATILGEVAYARVDVPESLSEIFGDTQFGGFLEVVLPVLQRRVFSLDEAQVNVAIRLEHIDYNVGHFGSTNDRVSDEVDALVLGTSFRPTSETVFKANYRYHWIADLLGNPGRLGGIQFGFATYF